MNFHSKPRLMKYCYFILVLFLTNTSSFAQCPVQGKEKAGSTPLNDEEKALNTAKNNSTSIPAGSADYWDINEVINAPVHNDRDEFTKGAYSFLEGYLINYTLEKGESCNCYLANNDQVKYGDIHIYIGLTPHAAKKDCVIVEITPKYKKMNSDYLSFLQQMKGKQVRVFGYLLYDFMHEKNSANLCQACTPVAVWRKTCWEIHPIVAMEEL